MPSFYIKRDLSMGTVTRHLVKYVFSKDPPFRLCVTCVPVTSQEQAALQNDILGHISYGKKHACALILKGEKSDFPKRGCTITLRRGCRGNWVLCPMDQFSKGLCLSASFPCASQFASSWNIHFLNLVPALHSYLRPSTEISFKMKSPIIQCDCILFPLFL